jgi:ABC-type phosphate transport system permease subunit
MQGQVVRGVVKPLLEMLAGIPTIVYGFFALVTVGPFLRDISAQLNGLGGYVNFIQAQSVLTAGLVMGIMLIPFVSSLSDDIITRCHVRCATARSASVRHAPKPSNASSCRPHCRASSALCC